MRRRNLAHGSRPSPLLLALGGVVVALGALLIAYRKCGLLQAAQSSQSSLVSLRSRSSSGRGPEYIAITAASATLPSSGSGRIELRHPLWWHGPVWSGSGYGSGAQLNQCAGGSSTLHTCINQTTSNSLLAAAAGMRYMICCFAHVRNCFESACFNVQTHFISCCPSNAPFPEAINILMSLLRSGRVREEDVWVSNLGEWADEWVQGGWVGRWAGELVQVGLRRSTSASGCDRSALDARMRSGQAFL
jgi:hypothetical protein